MLKHVYINQSYTCEGIRMELSTRIEEMNQSFISLNENEEIIHANKGAEELLELPADFLCGKNITAVLPGFVHTSFYPKLKAAINQKSFLEFQDYYPALQRWFELRVYPGLIGINTYLVDITDQKHKDKILTKKRILLEMIAKGKPLAEILKQIIHSIEELTNNAYCTIMLIDKKGKHLRLGAAPSLPDRLSSDLDGIEIGPQSSSCGTAAYFKKKMVVTNIHKDVNWRSSKKSLLSHGLQSCWSTPILNSSCDVLGTFAMYYKETRSPSDIDIQLVEQWTNLASIAIEQYYSKVNKIQETESKYRLIADHMSDLIKVMDLNRKVEYASPSITTVLGYEPEDYKVEYIHPADFDNCNRIFQEVVEKKVTKKTEYRQRHADQRWLDFEAALSPIINDEGEVESVLIVSRDITEQVKARKELMKSEEKFRSVVESATEGIIVTDYQARIVSWNKGARQLFGFTEEEAVGREIDQLVPEYFLNKYIYRVSEYLTKKDEDIFGRPIEVVGLLPNEENDPVELSINTWGSGVDKFFSIIIRDISERNRVEEALEKSEDKYRRLIEDLPEAVMIIRHSKIIFVNNKVLHLLQAASKEELISKSITEFIHPDCQYLLKEIRSKISQTNNVDKLEIKLMTLTYEPIDVEVNVALTSYEGEKAVQLIFRDITELKKSKEFLQNADKLSVAGELAAGIAHEIRNPLTSIKGFIQLAQQSDIKPEKYYPIMLMEIDRINTIISELLLLSKPNVSDYKSQDIRRTIDDVLNFFYAQATLHNIEINKEISIIGAVVNCHENQLKQVLINLLKNASEAMPTGGVINVSLTGEKDTLVLQVIDSGLGIKTEHIPKLGQPFFTTKDTGTGLGLATCLSIIENHKGSMKIDSQEGKGTTVTIRLPKIAD